MRTQATIHWRRAGVGQAVPALLAAALVLGGCSATHVGDAWQCPVAQGAACASVAEADPAVKKAEKAREAAVPALPGQLEVDDADRLGGECAGGCDPLAWLTKWLGGLAGPGGTTAVAEPEPVSASEEAPDPVSEDLRTRERIARIWIAPFVDSDGVYREGHWVRAVLEPSRWRLR
ncbi:MAG: type IV conjugative transfer system lipoprotein TraV [Deltaproteobacteria bacterium]|nr:type IV conjugative transfer system lipoprotein TraV [Deltaproteobacteria bacterium]MDE0355857.1 type IV conjugative transfer system lipoprotein TraV [Deltaproteobacteria bacterium]